jgi:7,8-dihydropterin-6-yl-methyl-4-(beta-D-ribofuranosyl)aminobenzene 5'-phosphate synthase
MTHLDLKPVQHIEVTTLLDNYVDVLLESTPRAKRPPMAKGDLIPTDTLIAEHGLSLLIKANDSQNQHTILFDTGYNSHSVIHNMDSLGVDAKDIEMVVISHAHMDHAGALYSLVERMDKPVPLVAHPGIFTVVRMLKTKDGKLLKFPNCYDRQRMETAGIDYIESRTPISIAGDTIAVTGEVERTTDFEKGMPNAIIQQEDGNRFDPMADDQSLVLHLEGKGLVLITGCCHSGIINTLTYAQKITGINAVYAVLGGLHLSGPAFAPIVDQTITELAQFNPDLIVPMHCTGWQSINRIADAFPDAFVLNSVGTTYILE